MQSTPWLMQQPGGPSGSLRLYCFSYAGGNAASFIPWQAALTPEIEVCPVQLPGRGMRLSDPLIYSFDELVSILYKIISNQDKQPFAFFGHSLGALVAFELARLFQRESGKMPSHLFVSGCDAPQHRSPSRRLHELEDDELINELKEYNGTPVEALSNRELMKLVLPAIRADFSLVTDYQYRPGLSLEIPITVLAGNEDNHIKPDTVVEWRKETTNICQLHWFNGDHFFINSNNKAILKCLKDYFNKPVY